MTIINNYELFSFVPIQFTDVFTITHARNHQGCKARDVWGRVEVVSDFAYVDNLIYCYATDKEKVYN